MAKRILVGSTLMVKELLLDSDNFREGYISLKGKKKTGKPDFDIFDEEKGEYYNGSLKDKTHSRAKT